MSSVSYTHTFHNDIVLLQMIEEVEERFTEDEITDILETINTILPHFTTKEQSKKIKRTRC